MIVYVKVFMDAETNLRMLHGEPVRGTLSRQKDDDMMITVSPDRVTKLEYPFALVQPAD